MYQCNVYIVDLLRLFLFLYVLLIFQPQMIWKLVEIMDSRLKICHKIVQQQSNLLMSRIMQKKNKSLPSTQKKLIFIKTSKQQILRQFLKDLFIFLMEYLLIVGLQIQTTIQNCYNNSLFFIMKNQQVNRFVVFLTLLIPSSYLYNFDWPQSLSTVLQDTPYSYGLKQVQLYYTIPQLIALILCFKLGMIFDQMELQKLLILVPSFILISHTLIAISFIVTFSGTYYLTIIFRAFFAVMGESTFILQAMILGKLLGQKATLIVGLGQIIPAVFQPLNSLLTPLIFSYSKQISTPLFTGSGICLLILLICIYLRFKINQQKEQIKNQSPPPAELIAEAKQNKTLLDQIKSFSLPFWLLQLQILIMYILTFVFVSIAFDLIVKRFQFEYTKGGQIIMIPFLTSVLFSLIWLCLIKKFPSYRRIFYIVINLLAFIAHISLYFLPNSDGGDNTVQLISIIFILIFIGICTGGLLMIMAASIYLVSEKQQTGAAFSIATMGLSFGYVIIPSIVGYISQNSGDLKIGYRYSSFVFIGFSILGLLLSCYLKLKAQKFMIYDKKGEEEQNKVQTLNTVQSFKVDQVKISSNILIEDKPIRQISSSMN